MVTDTVPDRGGGDQGPWSIPELRDDSVDVKWPRALVTGAAAALLLMACAGEDLQPASQGTARLAAEGVSSVREVAKKLFEACRVGDDVAVVSLVEHELRDQPWEQACAAAADHGLVLREHRTAVRGSSATVHVRVEGKGTIHEEDWYFGRRAAKWRLTHVAPVFTGSWDVDAHKWLTATAVPRPSAIHPEPDGHDHTTAAAPPVVHFEGDGHDHTPETAPPPVVHFEGDGHDHTRETAPPPVVHFEGDGHDHTPVTLPTPGHDDKDDGEHDR
jgi:hypothetical protein